MRIGVPLAIAAVLYCAWSSTAEAGMAALDSGLFSMYQYADDQSSIAVTICGNVGDSGGCFGGGTLGPFERACALLEGTPHTKGDVVTRALYVLDARKSSTAPIVLYVYVRTDKIDPPFDDINFTLKKQLPLGITGGIKSRCSMAANEGFVYAGTDASSAVAINKIHFTIAPASNGPVSAITADSRGYVAIVSPSETGIVAPDGTGVFGMNFQALYEANTRNALKPH